MSADKILAVEALLAGDEYGVCWSADIVIEDERIRALKKKSDVIENWPVLQNAIAVHYRGCC